MSVVPWKEMLAGAATVGVITTQTHYKLPAPLQHGLIGTTVLLYLIQFVGWCLYWIFLWPKYLSPLRDLPEPKVYMIHPLPRFMSLVWVVSNSSREITG